MFVRALPLLALIGCAPSAPVGPAAPNSQPVEVRSCTGGTLAEVAQGEFDHTGNSISVALGWPRHIAEDTLATDGDWMPLNAKFAYGATNNDLEDEEVEIWIGNCQGSVDFMGTTRTDDDGRISVGLDPSAVAGYGEFTVFYRVVGDGSVTTATLSKYPVGTRLLVFDIDGTLTTADSELFIDMFSELGSGSYLPEARPGAVQTVATRYDQNYEIVYLTGRPYWLDGITRDWLDALALPPGTLHLARTNGEALPIDSGVGEYKADYLSELQALGFVFDFAYGNATTDIYGYANAGIPADRTLIMGTNGGEQGTLAGGDDYLVHLATIGAEPAISQPFTR